MNLNSILIGSDDPRRLADYYGGLFGEPTWNEGGYIGWMIGSGALTIGPHDQVTGKNPQPGRIIWNIETADVRAEFERFREPPPLRRGPERVLREHGADIGDARPQ